jgi:hypothetical protein
MVYHTYRLYRFLGYIIDLETIFCVKNWYAKGLYRIHSVLYSKKYSKQYIQLPSTIIVVTWNSSRHHFSSEKYRAVLSYKLHFLQNSSFVQLYTSFSDCKGPGNIPENHFVKSFLIIPFFTFLGARQPRMVQGLLIHKVSRTHTTTHHTRYDSSGRVINPSQRPLPDITHHSQQTNIQAPVGFERTISAGERPQTHASDRAVTGTR